jgi:hypothetical protein
MAQIVSKGAPSSKNDYKSTHFFAYVQIFYYLCTIFVAKRGMKHTRHTIFAALTAAVLLLVGVTGAEAKKPKPVEDFTADGLAYHVLRQAPDGEVELTAPSGEAPKYSGDIVVPDSVALGENRYAVVAIGDAAFKGADELRSVRLGESIRIIGAYAFSGCDQLERVSLPRVMQAIRVGAFQYCTSLDSVVLPETLRNVEFGLFMHCHALQTIVFPESLQQIGERAFAYCSELRSLTLPAHLTTINNEAFYQCPKLEEIVWPKSLARIGLRAFSNCIALRELDLPNHLRILGESAFEGCTGLKTVSLGSGLAEMGDAVFRNCYEMELLRIAPECKKVMRRTQFAGCLKLQIEVVE